MDLLNLPPTFPICDGLQTNSGSLIDYMLDRNSVCEEYSYNSQLTDESVRVPGNTDCSEIDAKHPRGVLLN